MQQTYVYLFDQISGRYIVFLTSIKAFWEQTLAIVGPSSKIKVHELKYVLFESISALKQRYCETHILKSLCNLRL
ncbi:MAG: hypothetical protein ACK521_10345 [bacterium]